MGDHFVLLVDRLITASTLQAAIESQNMNRIPVAEEKPSVGSTHNWNLVGEGESGSTVPNLVECRICQDEDHDCNMESPCACCGSLKYAHRKCIQRWCNEKGNTVCEICHQQFKPGYTAPPQMFHYGGIPMNFRGSWEISRQDLRNSQFLAMVATDRNFLDSEYDELAASTTRNAFYCRVVAVLFTVLLLLRHVLPILIGEADEYDITILTLSVLKSAAILVPVYVMIQTLTSVHCRRRQQVIQDLLPRSVSPSTDGERLNVIRVT